MKDQFDFSECDFINSEMKFYSYKDFIQNRQGIKRLYEKELSKYGKIFYKWYVYSNIHISTGQKNKAWDWLNGYCTSEELIEYENRRPN